MVVFITPRVIYDTNQLVEATEELRSGFRRLRPLLDR
jgi:general secretion pathway protein D